MNVHADRARELERFDFADLGRVALGLGTVGVGGAAIGAARAVADAAARKARATSERTLALNRRYAVKLGWQAHRAWIALLLGFAWGSPSEALFAEGVAQWQRRNGIDDDGVLGPDSWKRMRAMLGLRDEPRASSPTTPAPAPTPLPTGSIGTLIAERPGKRRFTYAFTPEDVLWTARFVVGEAGGRDDRGNQAVIQAMLNQYAFFRHTSYSTFAAFLRAYSTTLQPTLNSKDAVLRSMDSPNFVATGGFFPGTLIPRGQLRRHIELQRAPWERLPAAARNLASRALGGRMANPGIGNANEFASTWILLRVKLRRADPERVPTEDEWLRYTESVYRHKRLRWIGAVAGLDQKKNAFFIHEDLAPLPPNSARVAPAPQ